MDEITITLNQQRLIKQYMDKLKEMNQLLDEIRKTGINCIERLEDIICDIEEDNAENKSGIYNFEREVII